MFVKGFRGIRGLGEYQARTPSDWKSDNWIGQPIGGGLQTVASAGPSISTVAEVGGGLGFLALAAAAWWYFKK